MPSLMFTTAGSFTVPVGETFIWVTLVGGAGGVTPGASRAGGARLHGKWTVSAGTAIDVRPGAQGLDAPGAGGSSAQAAGAKLGGPGQIGTVQTSAGGGGASGVAPSLNTSIDRSIAGGGGGAGSGNNGGHGGAVGQAGSGPAPGGGGTGSAVGAGGGPSYAGGAGLSGVVGSWGASSGGGYGGWGYGPIPHGGGAGAGGLYGGGGGAGSATSPSSGGGGGSSGSAVFTDVTIDDGWNITGDGWVLIEWGSAPRGYRGIGLVRGSRG